MLSFLIVASLLPRPLSPRQIRWLSSKDRRRSHLLPQPGFRDPNQLHHWPPLIGLIMNQYHLIHVSHILDTTHIHHCSCTHTPILDTTHSHALIPVLNTARIHHRAHAHNHNLDLILGSMTIKHYLPLLKAALALFHQWLVSICIGNVHAHQRMMLWMRSP